MRDERDLARSLLHRFLGSGGTMKTTSLLHKISFICSVLFVTWGMAQCGGTTGEGAAPQSSIPLPNAQDPITVSAPDADGLVRVTGSVGAVPNIVVVVIEVGVSLSSLSAEPSVQDEAFVARTCSSALPECPSLDAENKCQYTANDDGSFTLQIPAEADQNILVSYLDPDSCAETAAYTVAVSDDVLGVDMDVVDVAFPTGSEALILFGSTETDETALISYHLDDLTTLSNSLDTVEGIPLSIDSFEDYYEVPYVIFTTADGIFILDEVGYDAGTFNGSHEILDDDAASFSGAQYLATNVTSYSYYDVAYAINQVYFYQDRSFYVFEFGDDMNDFYLGTGTADGNIETQALPVTFTIIEDSFNGFTTADITTFSYAGFVDDTFVLVLGFEYAAETWYVVLQRTYSYAEIYGTSLDFTESDTDMIVLGPATNGVYVNLIEGYSIEDYPYALTVLKIAEQNISIIDLGSDRLSCFDDDIIFLADASGADENNGCVDSGGEDQVQVASSDLDVSSVQLTDVLIDSTNYGEMFTVGNENSGSRFITQYGTESLFETEEVVSVIDPIFVGYYSTGNAIVVVDAGNDLDYVTNIVLYELATTPSSY